MQADRFHIGFFGKRNVGKSSLLNAITEQTVAIISEVPGTTTDPVFKAMELLPLGPVVLIDTAGLDDDHIELGESRKKRSARILGKTDLALLIVDSSSHDFSFEDSLLHHLEKEQIPYIVVLNKIDKGISPAAEQWLASKPHTRVSSVTNSGIAELKEKIIAIAPKEWEPPFLRDLIHPGDIVVLVVPIDLSAPKGRLIMPQVKAARDVLDADAIPVMCKDRELSTALKRLNVDPALVVTDSQAFSQVAAIVPNHVLLTSFSILSARQKGNLPELVQGVKAVKKLKSGDKVLIVEACTHHPLEDDIGRVKIPAWLNQTVGGGLVIDTVPGLEFPDDLAPYNLIIHCGACTLNRKEMLRRQKKAAEQSVPITNYGVLISFLKSVFPRALKPFPGIYALLEKTESP